MKCSDVTIFKISDISKTEFRGIKFRNIDQTFRFMTNANKIDYEV